MIYDNQMDLEVIPLCNALNSIKGVQTTGSCCGHGKQGIIIFLKFKTEKSLFFLLRCIDRRYWKYGTQWRLDLGIADAWDGNRYPICYSLVSRQKGKKAYNQAKDLIDNIDYHATHKNFLKEYKLKNVKKVSK